MHIPHLNGPREGHYLLNCDPFKVLFEFVFDISKDGLSAATKGTDAALRGDDTTLACGSKRSRTLKDADLLYSLLFSLRKTSPCFVFVSS